MRKQLFDRFESKKETTVASLTRDIADILGARRAISGGLPGVLSWGLPDIASKSPQKEEDRGEVAEYMRAALAQFEPRLENVEVLPVPNSRDFSFELKADLIADDDNVVTLRIVTPRRGGGLGAEVIVIGGETGQTAFIKNKEGDDGGLVDDS